ncbi:protein tiptop [Drosophila sulfurigaster albostrigata]|uniref:protein tiptop n=1 Tax=Drosophila sulfurigaster albostrigata TaxID=89887 RepID=UPI002D218389|nr:protein tiptop [Drosophila sulfurigaster albostrigata]
MMLHEAVMLEIYRQALSASELASPRCQSRESNASAAGAGDARCPSNESHCSANDCLTPAPTPTPTTAASPVGLPLTATLAPSAAAALLPPQSAAMAAYLAAAQQNHLLLTNPLAAAASLVQQATQQAASPAASNPHEEEEPPALDFSRKRATSECEAAASDEEQEELADQESAPLDLSVSTRKRQTPNLEQDSPARKLPRSDYKSPLPPGSWVPPLNPYLAAVAAKSAAGLSGKLAPSEATKALEKMSEMSRLETPPPSSRTPASNNSSVGAAGVSSGGGRHSAWQSHWLNKGADAAKDVFKCVWCKQSFATLALLTTHMKETQHCGVQVPSPSSNSNSTPGTTQPSSASRNNNATSTNSSNCSSNSSSTSSSSSKSELNMLIKETMPLPRKLVRGQDVWLGKGAEQTRQILKCMWCGQSFRSLAEMTSHMQETQHYTNIISQEQIISWKSGDERPSNGERSSAAVGGNNSSGGTPTAPSVSAVLTCKVCDQAFATLKELSTHMAQQSHYKDANAASSCASSSASPPAPTAGGAGKRGRQARNEKRKKSLPVRKLLELERSGSGGGLDSALKPLRDFAAATKITCEKCGSKIETALFVEHIRKCLGDSIPIPPRREQQRLASPSMQSEKPSNSSSTGGGPSVLNALEQLIEKSFESRVGRLAPGYPETGTPLGASILKRLGIDDSSDYTKPLMDAQVMQMQLLRSSYPSRDRSASESSSASRVESAYTPDRQQATPRRTPDTPASSVVATPSLPPPTSSIKSEPIEAEQELEATSNNNSRHLINVKKEFSMDSVTGNARGSPSASSERSNNSPPAVPATQTTNLAESGSLLALNSMFDQLSSVETNNNNTGLCFNNNNNNNSTGNGNSKKPKAHPLAALQKLCETTDPPASNTRSASSASSTTPSLGLGGVGGNDLVAFSWACNEAVLSASTAGAAGGGGGAGGGELIIKCSFCDTPFGSKGAYRHHLSKVHFVKDAAEDSPTTTTTTSAAAASQLKSPAAAQSPKSLPMASPKRSASRSPATPAVQQLPQTSPSTSLYDESPQSKFLKYTELAKQLSSKNA